MLSRIKRLLECGWDDFLLTIAWSGITSLVMIFLCLIGTGCTRIPVSQVVDTFVLSQLYNPSV
jgi:hypothetical protein